MKFYGIIYKITNKTNNKVYIGQTVNGFKRRYCASGKGIERVYNFLKNSKRNKRYYNDHLLKSIEKYGFENFEVCEIFDVAFSKEELNIKEICWISIYKSTNEKYGYNNTIGGESNNIWLNKSEEERLKIGNKISNSKIGRFTGKDNPNYGNKWSEKSRKQMRQSLIDLGYTRKIYQLDKDTYEIIKSFDSIAQATRELNLSKSSIKNVLSSKYRNKTAGNYAWTYVDCWNNKYDKGEIK